MRYTAVDIWKTRQKGRIPSLEGDFDCPELKRACMEILMSNKIMQEADNTIKRLSEEIQDKCEHNWVVVKDLLYFCGETYDGKQCPKCKLERKL